MTDDVRIVRVPASGPILVQGPVRIEMTDGTVVESDRFMVAICTCKRSKIFPLCDTSHRRCRRAGGSEQKSDPSGSGQGPA